MGCVSEVCEEAVDRFGRAVTGAGVVEEREDVCVVLFHGLPERVGLLEPGRDPGLGTGDQPGHGSGDASDPVERVTAAAPVSEGFVLHASAAVVEFLSTRAMTWKGSITVTASGSSSAVAVL